MARRASSSTNPVLIIGIVVAVVALIAGGKFILSKKSEAFSDVPPLNVEHLLENGNSLRGDEYFVEGRIDGKLRWNPSQGQVVSIMVKTQGGEEPVPILIPDKFSKLNIEREQRYSFKVEVQQGGVPVATGINRL